MKWTWFLGSSLVIVSAACGPTLDVGQNQNDGSAPANGGAVCDAYATYCKIPSDSQKKVDDCRSAAMEAKCGTKAADVYRCLMDNKAECNGSYELDDNISACASTRSAYESCLESGDACKTDADCMSASASGPRCKAATVCTACLTDSDCAGTGRPHCLVATKPSDQNRCEECVTNAHCTDPAAPVCSSSTGYSCHECDTATDCKDPARPYCSQLKNHKCAECSGHGVSGGCPQGKTCYNDECK